MIAGMSGLGAILSGTLSMGKSQFVAIELRTLL